MKSHYFNLAKLGGSLGSFALASLIDPTGGFIAKILEAISGNLASNFVAKYDPETLLEYLTNDNHELNHDIEKLMIASVPKAVELVKEKYLRENPYKDTFVKNTLNSIVENAQRKTYDTGEQLQMTHNRQAWLNGIHDYIFREYEEEDGKLAEIETFFKKHLAEYYQLVFTEGLKDDKNEKPFKAFIIKSLEGLSQQLPANTLLLTDIKAEIQALKQGEPGKSLPVAKNYFNKEFQTINQKLDTILQILSESQITNRAIPHQLTPPPFMPEVFLGREEELMDIYEKLSDSSHFLLLVNGEGGIGKTSLASKYYHTYQHKYAHTAWILSEQSIVNALLTLAKPLNIRFEDNTPQEERLRLLLTAMASLPKPCLLIIDNANEIEDLEENYQLLRNCANFHILLTTRITNFHLAAQYKTEGLSETQALALFRKYYPKHKTDENERFKQIYHAVNGNTLVIEILAKNLNLLNELETDYTLNDLLNDLQSKGLLELSQSTEIAIDYQKIRKAKPQDIIQAMYDLGQLSPQEMLLLSVFSVLPAESISFKVLKTLLPGIANLKETILPLSKKGWLDYNRTEVSFKCSPVIQEITQKKNPQLFDDCLDLIKTFIDRLTYEPGTGNLVNMTYEESLLDSRYAESVVNSFDNTHFDLAQLCKTVGNYYQTYGNTEKALQFAEKHSRIIESIYRNAPDDKVNKNNLVMAYEKLGVMNQSLGKLDVALAFFQKVAGLLEEFYKDYPNEVGFKNNLAVAYERLGELYRTLGQLDKAREYFHKDAKIFEELYSQYPNQVSYINGVAIAYQFLGAIYQSLQKPDVALEFILRCIYFMEALYNAFPIQADFKNTLAIAYGTSGDLNKVLGKPDEALPLFQKSLQLYGELYRDYPNQSLFKNGLAVSYQKLGRHYETLGEWDKALALFLKYTRLSEELYNDYPEQVVFVYGLATAYIWLGFAYISTKETEKGQSYYQKALPILENLYQKVPIPQYEQQLGWLRKALADLGNT